MHLKTLGGLELTVGDGAEALRRPKPLLLLAYLALEGPKERHHLAELFWPRAQRPLDSLRVALSQLRTVAPEALIETTSPGGSRVGAGTGCDAVELLEALAGSDLKRARKLYEGEFLAGFYLKEIGAELEEWLLSTREHLATSLQLACLAAAEDLAQGSAFAEAASLAADALRLTAEAEPDLLPRFYNLLAAAAHPSAAVVERQAAAYGMNMSTTTDAARAALSSSRKQTARNNLPSPVAPFVGRDTELVTLTNVVASGSRLVTVTGVGGAGKSRLALEAARTALRDGLFDDGVFLVELAPVADHRHVLAAIAVTFDPAGTASDAARLHETIGDKKVLLLLDNFEHVTEAALELAKVLERCPGLALLVTSRQPLDLSGEQLYPLGELALPLSPSPAARALTFDAVRLFQATARRAHLPFAVADDNIDAVLEICRLVHSLPLGIELAASLIGHLQPSDVVAALHRNLNEVLSGPRDAAPRQRSLRSTIEYSWSLLSEPQSLVLTKLAAFTGGFTREAASHVAGASIATLASLSAKSLLKPTAEGRYDMHPLVGGYARERLAASADLRDAVLAAHAEYYVDLAGKAEEGLKAGDQAGWLRRLDDELANLHAATERLLSQAQGGEAEAAAAALRVSGALWQFWMRRGRLTEGRRLADAALAAASPYELPLERAKTLSGAGALASNQGDYAASEAYNREALELRRACGDRLGEARSLYNLAGSAGRAGDLELAEQYLTAAITVFTELDDKWSVAFALFNLATLARHQGRDDEAAAHLEERLRLQLALGDEAGTAETYYGLGLIALSTNDHSKAEGLFEQALAAAKHMQDYPQKAAALDGLALLAHERGQRTRSGKLFDEAAAIRGEHGLALTPAHRKLMAIHGSRPLARSKQA